MNEGWVVAIIVFSICAFGAIAITFGGSSDYKICVENNRPNCELLINRK